MTQTKTLQERLVEGIQRTRTLQKYLALETWTPLQAVLLVCGVHPPAEDGAEIPVGGVGLDNKVLHGSNGRFHDARRLLHQWHDWCEDQDKVVSEINPYEFINWCLDEPWESDWLRLFMDVGGYPANDRIDLTPSAFSLLVAPALLQGDLSQIIGDKPAASDAGAGTRKINGRDYATRSNPLRSIIQKAQELALNPSDYESVWIELVKLARSDDRPEPLLGFADKEGVKWLDGEEVKFLNKDALRKRLKRAAVS